MAYTEVLKYGNNFEVKSEIEKKRKIAYNSYIDMFNDIPFEDRKLVMIVADYEKQIPDFEFVTLVKNNLPDVLFPIGHPINGGLYVAHPYDNKKYYPYEIHINKLFEEKYSELVRFLQCLGAKSIVVNSSENEATDKNIKKDTTVDIDGGIGIHNMKGKYTHTTEQTSKQTREKVFYTEQEFIPKKKPYLPEDLKWYYHEALWQGIAKQRLDGNMIKIILKLNSNDLYTFSRNEIQEIEANYKSALKKIGANIKWTVKESKNLKSQRNCELLITVEFVSVDDLE